ncbi:DUF4181 domain-containing protein [Virgibacillus flavescens]|uniref:DUF4181 domain-containing protein n=1 Tax=Virgibacillus flavescens TaxID=1611422 RepID=UPI003D333A80
MKVVAFLVILLILLFVLEKTTNKLLGVQKEKIANTPGKNIDRWGRGIILIIFLITLWFVIEKDSDVILKLYFMIYFALLSGFQAVLELIYIKDSKQYISTTILLLVGLIIIYNTDFLF